MGSYDSENGVAPALRYIPLSYSPADSQATALRLILTLFPDWEGPENKIEFVRFTDGITNTLLKIINRKDGLTDAQIDNDAVLMRAYGNGTEILIDREIILFVFLQEKPPRMLFWPAVASPLPSSPASTMVYSTVSFVVSPAGTWTWLLPPIYRGVARRLAQWHAVLPSKGTSSTPSQEASIIAHSEAESAKEEEGFDVIQPRRAGPSMWAVLQKWILALPTSTPEQRSRRLTLQKELQWVLAQLDDGKGIGEDGLVFSHCDLLCANVIVLPTEDGSKSEDNVTNVNFIDYEYAVPAPAAFDIANHLAEWIGYDCDYNMTPTKSVRRQFLTEYTKSYCENRGLDESSQAEIVDRLVQDVDRFRGIPGLYWGVWSLIQAQISQIDFDYAGYAETRLGEYWAWKREMDGSRKKAGEEMPLREQRWALEA
ncbi:uncharacterized protein N7469_001430 [Penicillium citrinum]|uniref:ethanolamine kinase n=1 Tax=Penicillium citrinum TaxID=5077 RepID=A0A9W9PHJ9_PENCI|nr:uncharacterized protein N7469_001430 [Penicillium citrinum]KAJ5243103.1 hypothetical protein N7469_001430 [Penicillium citrinum]